MQSHAPPLEQLRILAISKAVVSLPTKGCPTNKIEGGNKPFFISSLNEQISFLFPITFSNIF